MTVYLKNGSKIKVCARVATELANMMVSTKKDRENVLVTRHILKMPNENVASLFDITEIAAIK